MDEEFIWVHSSEEYSPSQRKRHSDWSGLNHQAVEKRDHNALLAFFPYLFHLWDGPSISANLLGNTDTQRYVSIVPSVFLNPDHLNQGDNGNNHQRGCKDGSAVKALAWNWPPEFPLLDFGDNWKDIVLKSSRASIQEKYTVTLRG